MATRIQVRRDTAANWAAAPTTVLASGEIGFETDTLQFKIGNNADQWQNLEYAGGTTPIRQNASGTTITDLNAAALVNNGNAKYLILGADSVSNEPAGLTTATDGQLLVTVSKYDYLGTSAANERLLMTLTTLTTGKTYYRTYNGSWSSWYLVVTGDVSGNATVPGDLAVNGGDITTNQTTATVFNTTATTLNVGQAATTVSIGATTGTATIRNATTAISGAATVGSTLAVTGNTTLTGDLAVNGSDITTTSAGTATVFNTNAAALCLGEAAPTVSIGASTGTTTINNDLAVTGADITTSSVGTATLFNTNATTLNVGGAATTVSIGAATGTTTVNNDLAVNGGDITTNQTAAAVFNTTASTLNVGGAATTVSIGASSGTTTVNNDLAVNGGDITTNQTTATVFNTTATTLNVGQAATTVSIGATTGTATIRNATTAIAGSLTVTGTISGPGTIPVGGIIMWSGVSVPTGWSLCDGGSGTPDLRNRFIICGNLSAVTGNITQTNITGAATQTGGSKDSVIVSHTHTATSAVTDPGHTHASSKFDLQVADSGLSGQQTNNDGRLIATNSATTGITVATTITAAGESGTNKNLPPYYALAFIMRTT